MCPCTNASCVHASCTHASEQHTCSCRALPHLIRHLCRVHRRLHLGVAEAGGHRPACVHACVRVRVCVCACACVLACKRACVQACERACIMRQASAPRRPCFACAPGAAGRMQAQRAPLDAQHLPKGVLVAVRHLKLFPLRPELVVRPRVGERGGVHKYGARAVDLRRGGRGRRGR